MEFHPGPALGASILFTLALWHPHVGCYGEVPWRWRMHPPPDDTRHKNVMTAIRERSFLGLRDGLAVDRRPWTADTTPRPRRRQLMPERVNFAHRVQAARLVNAAGARGFRELDEGILRPLARPNMGVIQAGSFHIRGDHDITPKKTIGRPAAGKDLFDIQPEETGPGLRYIGDAREYAWNGFDRASDYMDYDHYGSFKEPEPLGGLTQIYSVGDLSQDSVLARRHSQYFPSQRQGGRNRYLASHQADSMSSEEFGRGAGVGKRAAFRRDGQQEVVVPEPEEDTVGTVVRLSNSVKENREKYRKRWRGIHAVLSGLNRKHQQDADFSLVNNEDTGNGLGEDFAYSHDLA